MTRSPAAADLFSECLETWHLQARHHRAHEDESCNCDGVPSSTITLTLNGTSRNFVSGVTPHFSATDTGSTNLYGACSVCDGSGVRGRRNPQRRRSGARAPSFVASPRSRLAPWPSCT